MVSDSRFCGMLASSHGWDILLSLVSLQEQRFCSVHGRKRDDKVVPAWFANICISTLMGSLLTFVMFLFSGKIGVMLGMSSVQNEYASSYLAIIVLNFILVGLRTSYGSILASKGLTHWNMTASMITNVINIPLNWVLLTGFWIFPELGIRGIALATVISYFAGFCVIFYMVHFRLKVSFLLKIL